MSTPSAIDVCRHGTGWGRAELNQDATVLLVSERLGLLWAQGLPEPAAWVRCASDGWDIMAVMTWPVQDLDHGFLVSNLGPPLDLGPTYGQSPVIVTHEAEGFVVYVIPFFGPHDPRNGTLYYRWPLAGVRGPLQPIVGPDGPTVLGILYVSDQQPVWGQTGGDYTRTRIDGVRFTMPCVSGAVTLGQDDGDSAIIAATPDGLSTVFQGQGFEPHVAELRDGWYACCARMLNNTAAFRVCPPWPAFQVAQPEPIPEPTPPVGNDPNDPEIPPFTPDPPDEENDMPAPLLQGNSYDALLEAGAKYAAVKFNVPREPLDEALQGCVQAADAIRKHGIDATPIELAEMSNLRILSQNNTDLVEEVAQQIAAVRLQRGR